MIFDNLIRPDFILKIRVDLGLAFSKFVGYDSAGFCRTFS